MCLSPSPCCLLYFFLYFRLFFCLELKLFRTAKLCTCDVHILEHVCPLYLGASRTEAYFSSNKLITYVFLLICTFSFFSPLYASRWLKFWPSWVAWLLCLCPTFPLVRLGNKGSTSVIVTVGSSRSVPQTGWSQKLEFLREYSVGELKMFFAFAPFANPQKIYIYIYIYIHIYILRFFQSRFGHAV